MSEENSRKIIREEIGSIFRNKKNDFIPGKSKVQYAGAVYGEEEVSAMVDSILDGWFGVGKQAYSFETKLSRYLGAKECILTNSGSSANLVAVATLCSRQAKNRLMPGDEVITPACTFPTTLNPLLQNGLKPVLLDVELGTYNINAENLHAALSEKTRLIMLPHTLGNPNEMDAIMDFAKERNLLVIEDACDALGSTYRGKALGSFGTMGTVSFYPAHHITMGEGGAVVVNDPGLGQTARSIRDWGRACTCQTCKVSTDHDYRCPMRFEFKTGTLPAGYDKRYIYTNIGYNLKPVEFQAAMGIEQLKRLPDFIKMRNNNFRKLYGFFSEYSEWFILPHALQGADPAWFAFPLTITEKAPFDRRILLSFLEKNNIEARLLFAGDITKQPAYKDLRLKVSGRLDNCSTILERSFFLGVYPGLDEARMDYMLNCLERFFKDV